MPMARLKIGQALAVDEALRHHLAGSAEVVADEGAGDELPRHVDCHHAGTQFVGHQVDGSLCASLQAKEEAVGIHFERAVGHCGMIDVEKKEVVLKAQRVGACGLYPFT